MSEQKSRRVQRVLIPLMVITFVGLGWALTRPKLKPKVPGVAAENAPAAGGAPAAEATSRAGAAAKPSEPARPGEDVAEATRILGINQVGPDTPRPEVPNHPASLQGFERYSEKDKKHAVPEAVAHPELAAPSLPPSTPPAEPGPRPSAPVYPMLKVVTHPAGARVDVEGQTIGLSPVSKVAPPNSLFPTLKVRIELAKHEPWSGEIKADDKGNFNLDVGLKPSKR